MRKINFFALFPIYGTVMLCIYSYYFCFIKKKLIKKKFYLFSFTSGLVGFLFILVSVLFIKFMKSSLDSDYLNEVGLFVAFVLGGVFMNIYSFITFNKEILPNIEK